MIFLIWLLPLITFAQDFSQKSFTFGTRGSFYTDNQKWDNTFMYYIPEYSDETFGKTVGQRRKFKLRVFDYTSSSENLVIDPLDVSYELFTNNNSFQVGFVRYRFSESFGLQLLDVANPRDYSEFIFNDLSWSKRSVFGVNDTYKWNDFSQQFILTLWPNGDRLPYKGSPFDPTQGQTDYKGGVIERRPHVKDLEFGTRSKYLFLNGLDLSFLYYHHHSRPTFQDLKLVGPFQLSARPTNHMVDSFGTSASFVLKDWVMRADVLYTNNDLIQKSLVTYKEQNHAQSLFGLDRTYERFLIGIQTQSDYTTNRHFYGLRGEWTEIPYWKPSAMVFRNFLNNGQWLQLKSLFEVKEWKFSVSYDNIYAGSDVNDIFGLYSNLDRVLVDASYTY